MKKNDFLNILGFLLLPFLAVFLIIIYPLGMLYSYIVYKTEEKKMKKLGIASKLTIEGKEIKRFDEVTSQTIGEIEVKRNGDKIEFVSRCGVNAMMSYMEVSNLIKKFQEELTLEKLTDKEFKRFKKVVDSEWMRRKFNDNSK